MVGLLLPAGAALVSALNYPIPPDAGLTVGQVTLEEGAGRSDLLGCAHYSLSEVQVRRMFRSYHLLTGEDYDYSYIQLACHISGTIHYKGRSYRWSASPGNTIWTTWPDNTTKYLGGKPTANTHKVR